MAVTFPHLCLRGKMLIDYAIECFLVLKIPFESAKMFPALAIKKNVLKTIFSFVYSPWNVSRMGEEKPSWRLWAYLE